jgi:hypothetical protein
MYDINEAIAGLNRHDRHAMGACFLAMRDDEHDVTYRRLYEAWAFTCFNA